MSRKSKLILATALFGAALFAASCGGGGGGGTTTTTGTGSGSGSGGGSGSGSGSGSTPPPASVEGKVLALLDVGTNRQVTICGLLSNGTASCGNNLNPDNVVLDYVHEFPNGNVVLRGPGNVLYFFDANSNTLTRLTSYRDLNNTPQTLSSGITIPPGSRYYATPNFLFMYNDNNLVAISRTGNVIMDLGVNIATDTANSDIVCERVAKGGNTFRLNVDGTVSIIPPAAVTRVEASAGGKFLLSVPNGANRDVYLSDSRCELLNPVLVAFNVNNLAGVKMVQSSGSYYIAIRYGATGNTLDYYRVTGNTRTPLQTNLVLRAANQNLYEIDGLGNLYYNNATDNIGAVTPNGTLLGPLNLDGTPSGQVDGILAFNDRVLARDQDAGVVYDVSINSTPAIVVAPNPTGGDLTALQRCTDANTRNVNGRGTSLVRCVFDNGAAGGERLVVFVHNTSGVFAFSDIQINATSAAGGNITRDHIRFGANAVLVPTRTGATSPHVINLCSVTTSPALTVFCSPTDLPNPVNAPNIIPLADTTRIYPFTNLLKFNGNNVLYLSGATAPFIPKFGDIFSTPQAVPIPINSASGGNASLDLNKFAFSFRPAGAPCATQIVYFSSRTASQKTYTIAQPSNGCVARILKVFP